MIIGIISREYPPLTHIGGIATFSATTAALLSQHGHEVHVLCNGPETIKVMYQGIHIHRIKMQPHHFRPGRLFFLYRKWFRDTLPHYLDALTWARTVREYIRLHLESTLFDLWEFPETGGEGAFLPIFPHVTPTRIIARIHTGWLEDYAKNRIESWLLLSLQRKACQRAHQLVSPSAFMAGDYISKTLNLGLPVAVNRNPILLWKNRIDWSLKSMNHILYVGRIEHRKGLQVLLQALERMGTDAEAITLRIVGHCHPPTRELDQQCQNYFKARLENQTPGHCKIEYIGPCQHSDLASHFDWAGIQVIPSLMENYPYVALEGLSRGCYLLGSAVGGIPEIITTPARGILFESENSTQLAEKIRECRLKALEIGKSMPNIAESIRIEFDPETCYQRLMEVYDNTLSKKVKAGGLSPD